MAVTSKAIKREDLKPGDEVFVIVRYGRDGSQVKRKKARVVDVLRAAVVLDKIEGEAGPRTVRFNEIEHIDSPPPPVVSNRRGGKPPPAPEEPFVDSSALRAVPKGFVTLAEVLAPPKPAAAPAKEPPKEEKPKAEPPKAEKPQPVQPPASPVDDVSAWIAQGASMVTKLSESRESLKAEIAALEDEALRIQIEMEEKQKERDRISQMIDALSKIQSVVSS